MKKYLLFIAMVSALVGLQAKPVSVEQAKMLAGKYVAANMPNLRSAEVDLVYTLSDEAMTPCLYVMNYEKGFVIMSADDVAKPVLAYSDEGRFDANDIPDGLAYYLNFYKRQISNAVRSGIAQDSETAAEWCELRENGLPMKRDAKAVSPLLTTGWDQNEYYNYYCPSTNGPGGRAYAGCVACAMSQVMKYWNYPATGRGSHTYTVDMEGSELNGTQLSVDFSTATYNWNNMPNSLGWSSSSTQRNAIALLMYHCGVATDMGYSGSGSGTQSIRVVDAIRTYFSYSNLSKAVYRSNYSKTEYEDILIDNLDRGFPIYYSGHDSEMGHAFVCDGYDANRKFHFNWGWSNGGDGYFLIDALNPTVFFQTYDFNSDQMAITNIMPDYIADALPLAPSQFVGEPQSPSSLTGTISWTNPTKSWTNTTLTSLSKVVLMRGGNVIKTYNSVQPGQQMSYDDHVPSYGIYEYSIYAETTAGKGYLATTKVLYGPSCEWRFMCSSNNTQGWPGGKLSIYDASNEVMEEIALTSSGLVSEYVTMPEGNVTIKWTKPTTVVSAVSIIIKNEAGQNVVSITNESSENIPLTVYSVNNQCRACAEPVGLDAEVMEQGGQWGVKIVWERGGDANPSKYYVYRSEDGFEYTKIAEVSGSVKNYFDPMEGQYYYKVTAKYPTCESDYATTSTGDDYVHVIVTGVDEREGSVMVFPNPASDRLHIKGDGVVSVAVYNMVGQMVRSGNDGAEQVIDLGGMPSGVYLVKVVTADGEMVKRVSVMH